MRGCGEMVFWCHFHHSAGGDHCTKRGDAVWQKGYAMNKMGWCIFCADIRAYPGTLQTKFRRLWRVLFELPYLPCFGVSKDEKKVWRVAHTLCAWGGGARTRIGGIWPAHAGAPRYKKWGTPFCSNTLGVHPILSIYLLITTH